MTTTQPTSWRGALRAQCLAFLCICFFFGSSVSSKSADCPTVPFWFQIGPSPLIINPANTTDGQGPDSGMVRDLVIDPSGSSDRVIYIGTDSGGVWKTQDRGATWVPKTDFLPSLNIGAIALDPGNPSIVYAGSGNSLNVFLSSGAGLYTSTDGGDNWVVLGANIFTNQSINRIVLPVPNLVLVATSAGHFRSIDGGQNFGNNPPLFNNGLPTLSGNITDLHVDTAFANIVYAAVSGSGIFTSTDSGANFPSSGNIFTVAKGAPANFGYLSFAQSTKPDRFTIYVNAQLTSGSANAGVFKSGLLGISWSQISVNTSDIEVLAQEVGYAQTVGVDPQDANRLYVGGRALYMVTDGGVSGITAASRIDLSKVHADQHALVFSPPSHVTGPAPTPFYTGTDGGLATTTNSGSSWTLLNGSSACYFGNGSLATVLFRKISIGRSSTANNLYTYGAAQDLGVSVHRPDCPGSPWLYGWGGDASSVAVDPLNPQHAIASLGEGIFSTTDGGAGGTPSWQQSGNGLPRVNFLIFFDPNGQFVYAAGSDNILYQSADNGNSFTAIRTFPAQVFDLGTVPIDSNTIWVGLGDGTVQRTANAKAGSNANWTSIAIAGSPRSPVTGIAVDPANTSQAVAVFRPSGSSTRVAFRTVDN
ncbi:MAG: hypothetical protein E6L09_10955, partial [Verrucomicrobia bacterium]